MGNKLKKLLIRKTTFNEDDEMRTRLKLHFLLYSGKIFPVPSLVNNGIYCNYIASIRAIPRAKSAA